MQEIPKLIRARQLGQSGKGRSVREQAGLSVREVARLIGVDVATLSRWERGHARPRQEAAARWVDTCDAIERELYRAP